MEKSKKRSSTKFTFNVGYVLIGAAMIVIVVGLFTGAIDSTNIIELVWCLLLSAASFLGINLTRIAVENVTKINNGVNPIDDSKYHLKEDKDTGVELEDLIDSQKIP